ncbi:MAG TPA: hypothetical protein VMT22_06225 [Terriglobales bacterium]|nr:hypothetical protein [Terriglobales bacterium]
MAAAQLNELIEAYRTFGHLKAHIDPLDLRNLAAPALDADGFGFTAAHMDKLVVSESLRTGSPLTLRELIARLETIYCGTLGFEFMHIEDRGIRIWIQNGERPSKGAANLKAPSEFAFLPVSSTPKCSSSLSERNFSARRAFRSKARRH